MRECAAYQPPCRALPHTSGRAPARIPGPSAARRSAHGAPSASITASRWPIESRRPDTEIVGSATPLGTDGGGGTDRNADGCGEATQGGAQAG